MARKITRQMPDVTSVECCPSVTLGMKHSCRAVSWGAFVFRDVPVDVILKTYDFARLARGSGLVGLSHSGSWQWCVAEMLWFRPGCS